MALAEAELAKQNTHEMAKAILDGRANALERRLPEDELRRALERRRGSGGSDDDPSKDFDEHKIRRRRKRRERRVAAALMVLLVFGIGTIIAMTDTSKPILLGALAVGLLGVFANNVLYVRARHQHARDEAHRLHYEKEALPNDKLAIARVEKLLERLDRQERLLVQNVLRNAFFLVLLTLPVVGTALWLANPRAVLKTAIVIGMFETLTMISFVFARNRARQLEGAVQQADYELNLLMPDLAAKEHAERLYLKQQFELKRYYDEALRQSSSLSYIGAACVAGGFIIVGVTFGVVSGAGTPDKAVPPALVGGIGGVLANFVAVVFLHMHSGTIRALTAFHDRLVATNHMHLAHLMVSRVGEDEVHPAQSAALTALAPHVASAGEPNGRR